MYRSTYQTRNPLAVHSPLRSMPLLRPVEQVLGWSARTKAEWNLKMAISGLQNLEERLADDCRALGAANRIPGPMRRVWQAKAFRHINVTRAHLRDARRTLIAAQAAMLLLAPIGVAS